MVAMRRVAGLLLSTCACGAQVSDLPPFGDPTPVPGASSAVDEDDGTPTSTMLELIFSYTDAADGGRKHLRTMTRASFGDAWSAPQPMTFEITGMTDQTPRFSADDLTLYFASSRDPNTTGLDVWRTMRSAVGAPWGAPEEIAELVDATHDDKWFSPCADGRYLMISSRGGTGADIYEGVLGSAPPAVVAALSSSSGETGTWVAEDCLTAYFASTRSGDNRIWTATRKSLDAAWSDPVMVEDFLALGGNQEDPWMSRDQLTFYLVSDVSGSKDVYTATR